MANKPSDRTNRVKPSDQLNLTSLIDIIACVMFFLLIFLGMVPVVIIDAPLPKVASTADEIRKAKEMADKFDVTVWINEGGFVIKHGTATGKINKIDPKEYPYQQLHDYLVQVHGRNPNVTEITLVPDDHTIYEVMIKTMDASRSLAEKDAGYKKLSPEIATSVESLQFNKLFPDVIFGGI